MVGAGPGSLVVATSDSVRQAISAPTGEDKIKTKAFQPQAAISLPARPTHVAFCSGDDALAVAVENGAQVSVYQTTDLLSGSPQPLISIPTNGATLRALMPNPASAQEAQSHYLALVTVTGELLVADLKAAALLNGPNGPVLRSGVSTVAWSNKGKQLVAGLADGTCCQMTPDGVQKDLIPRPPALDNNCHGKVYYRFFFRHVPS